MLSLTLALRLFLGSTPSHLGVVTASAEQTCRVAAANDGVFPRVAHENPFLRDDARRSLNDPLGYKIQTKREDGAAEERLLFDLLTSAPASRLVLSWHAEDGRGHPLAPSPLVPPLLGGELALKRARVRAQELRVLARAAALRVTDPGRAAASVAVMRELDLPPAEGPTDRDGPPTLSEPVRLRASPLDGLGALRVAQGESKGESKGRPKKLRVTALRDVGKCPYKVYLTAALGLDAPRGPRYWWEPEAWRIGNVLHESLDEALPDLLSGKYADARATSLAHLPPLLAHRIPVLLRLPVLRAALERELGDLVAEALDSERAHLDAAKLLPVEYEQRFEEPFKAGGLRLSFQADRLDRGAGGAAHVTDYKSHPGREGRAKNATLSPETLQVSLYLHLLAPEAAPSFSVVHMGPGMRPRVQPIRESGEEARVLVDGALALAAELARGWRELHASPWPTTLLSRKSDWQADCGYCEFRTMCRGDHEPTLRRLEQSPDLKALREALPSTAKKTPEEDEE